MPLKRKGMDEEDSSEKVEQQQDNGTMGDAEKLRKKINKQNKRKILRCYVQVGLTDRGKLDPTHEDKLLASISTLYLYQV